MKKNLVIATLLVLSLSPVVNAADDWTGASVGVNLSQYNFKNKGHGDSFDTFFLAEDVWAQTNKSKSDNGAGVGLKAAYNWQTNNLVYGVLADLTHIDAQIKKETPGGINDGFYSFKRIDKLKWLSTVRGKFGVDVNGFLPYLTAGVAIGDIENTHQTVTCCPTLYESTKKDTRVGYVIGLGIEKKFTEQLGIDFDYSYVDFGKDSGHAHSTVGTTPAIPSNVKLDNNVSIIRLGLNYFF